jgi:hypothetical protein
MAFHRAADISVSTLPVVGFPAICCNRRIPGCENVWTNVETRAWCSKSNARDRRRWAFLANWRAPHSGFPDRRSVFSSGFVSSRANCVKRQCPLSLIAWTRRVPVRVRPCTGMDISARTGFPKCSSSSKNHPSEAGAPSASINCGFLCAVSTASLYGSDLLAANSTMAGTRKPRRKQPKIQVRDLLVSQLGESMVVASRNLREFTPQSRPQHARTQQVRQLLCIQLVVLAALLV